MDKYGLTEAEKKTNLHSYNHALFKNMMFFMDIVWEINILTGTAVVIEDRLDDLKNGMEFDYAEMYQDYLKNRIQKDDQTIFAQYLDFNQLTKIVDEVSVDIHILSKDKTADLYRVVLTPAYDENGLYCVYFGARNMQAEENRQLVEYRNQQQFRDALLVNSYFHYSFDVSGDGIIYGDYTTIDGRHLIREISGRDLPIHFEDFSKRWKECYEPQFVREQEADIFTISYLLNAFRCGERIIEVEVKQKVFNDEEREYARIIIVLTENPDDKHIFATVAWHDIDISRQNAIDLNLNLQKTNELLKKTISFEEQYRLASLANAIMVYSINLTRNLIEEEFYEIIEDKRYPMLEMVGLEAPCRFDVFCERWCRTKVAKESRRTFQKLYNREYLLDAYARGEQHVEIEFDTAVGRGIVLTTRNTAVLYKDQVTGDVIAIINTQDITAQREEERKQREIIRKANENLLAALEAEKEQVSIIGSIAEIYLSMYIFHLSADRYEELHADDLLKEILGKEGSLQANFPRIIQDFVCEEYRNDMTQFLQLDDLKERLSGKKIISNEFLTKQYGFCRASFIPVAGENPSEILDVLFAIQRIDEEKQKEIKAAEALREALADANKANSAKTDFLARMSHDIRTPMNGIMGMTAIAQTHIGDVERVTDCLNKISVSSRHLLDLINEVLDMSKIESGKLELRPEEFNLSDLIENLIAMCKAQIEEHHHDLNVTIHGIEHEKVIGDSQCIQQCFMNLMSNAIKYTPDGGKICLSITEKTTNRPKIGCYEFVFEDNGYGMSKEFMEHMFEPFTRANDARVEKIQGTGLGMSITKSVVQMMNGDIWVESELNKGTRFKVVIYLKLQSNEHIKVNEKLIGKHVLVVDDDPIACESACEILNQLEIKGEWALSGEEAIERIYKRHEKKNDYFSVIVDWRMPGMDGLTVLKKIRGQMGLSIPVIISSAYDWSDIELEAKKEGATAFLSKPLFKSRMEHVFKTILGLEGTQERQSSLNELYKEDYSGHRALVVEDNDLNAEIAEEILHMTGFEVERAENGKIAVEKITQSKENYYDIVFMDIQMPVLNGFEASELIRKIDRKDIKTLPILAMSANAFAEDVQKAKECGMNDHIAKPLNFDQLKKLLQIWLR